LAIERLPDTMEKREQAILGEEGKAFNELVGEEFLKNVLAVHKVDHKFFGELSLEEELQYHYGNMIQSGHPRMGGGFTSGKIKGIFS